MKVLMFNHLPAPYLVEFLNLMGKDIELTVIFKDSTSFDRENSWLNYKFETFEAVFLPKALFKKIKFLMKYINANYDLFWNADYSRIECILLTLCYRLRNKIVLMHADGGIPIPRFIDPIIRLVMKQANYFASSGAECDKYYAYYHVNSKKIVHYRFTSQTKRDLENNSKMTMNHDSYRSKLGIKDSITLFSVGQQIPRKGFDVLVKAMLRVDRSVELYIAGGYPEEEVKKIIAENMLNNIHFVGFKTKTELNEYFAASDLFVLPTRYDIWGLVINEAMSFGLPIISTEKCAAAVQFVDEFECGINVPIENEEAIANAINSLISDSAKRKIFANNSFNSIQEYTIENMALDYNKIFDKIVRES